MYTKNDYMYVWMYALFMYWMHCIVVYFLQTKEKQMQPKIIFFIYSFQIEDKNGGKMEGKWRKNGGKMEGK